jgi:hypothetical protein
MDGWLADWDPLPPIQLGSGLGSGAAVRTFHNNEHLFLAVTVPSIAEAEKEESAFPDDLQVGLARRMNETDFGRDFLRLGFSASSPAARNRTPGSKPLAIVPGILTAAHNEGHFTNFEIAIPFRFLRRIGTRGHQALILNVSYPLPDREEQDPNPGVNTFAYQVRYGTDSLVPVYFIELEIEPRK